MKIDYDILEELNETEYDHNCKIWRIGEITPEEAKDLEERSKLENPNVVRMEDNNYKLWGYVEYPEEADFTGPEEGDR